ncbi:MAG: sugar transferase [Pisciglobus halotolerans]|nr:sugar transferase [Pisciglobus halotolerans]
MSSVQQKVKRSADFILASLLLFISLILLIPIALLIKLEDGGPILFKQVRVGKDSKLFVIYKLRSMKPKIDRVHSNERGTIYSEWGDKVPDNFQFEESSKENPEVTKVGKFIRKTSIDELPQFWNVIIGNMSLIGPRPEVPDIAQYYDSFQSGRLRVKPGITGWAQINGRSDILHGMKVKLDNDYIDSYNLMLDFKILALTLLSVLGREGAI